MCVNLNTHEVQIFSDAVKVIVFLYYCFVLFLLVVVFVVILHSQNKDTNQLKYTNLAS